MPMKPMKDFSSRGAFDDLSTPFPAVEYLFPYMKKDWIYWEAAPGAGVLENHLMNSGYDTIGIDHTDYDFLDKQWEIKSFDAVLTNPPFSLKSKFLERCQKLNKPFALLLPVTTLGARNCQVHMHDVQVLFLPKRIDFTGKKAPWFSVAWFTKGFNLPHDLMFVDI